MENREAQVPSPVFWQMPGQVSGQDPGQVPGGAPAGPEVARRVRLLVERFPRADGDPWRGAEVEAATRMLPRTDREAVLALVRRLAAVGGAGGAGTGAGAREVTA